MYKESTERNHASASTLAPQSSFPTKARTLLHPICSSPPTPLPLRSSPAQTDLPRSQLFPSPPPYLLIHDCPPPTPLFSPPKRIFLVLSISPTLRTNSPASSPTLPHSFPNQRRTKQGIPSHGHRVDRRKGYLQAIVFYMYLRTALAQHTPNSTGLRQDPKERWQSGRLWRSRKPLSCKAPGVRIPLSPQRGFKVTAKWSSEKPSKQE